MAADHRSEHAESWDPLPTVLSLTKYLPYPAVAHAGGQYLLAHDRALARFARVEHLAPDTPINRDALPKAAGGPPAALLEGARPVLAGPLLKLFQLESVWAGSSIYWPIRRLFRGARAPWARIERADAVELQWSEMIALAPALRRRLPGTPLVGIAHDVITQRLERQAAEGGSPIRRALLRVAAARCRRREAATFAALDLLIVFSEKDAALARELAPGARVEVVHPGLGPTDALPRDADGDEPIVLFTGAMNRPENHGGVAWFLDEIWPAVLGAVPEARFVIAGANPPESLRARVEAAPRAELTGFVDSLEPWYARAALFVVPLRAGAGVKFKTIDAMLRGVPIVTTEVGAEGIGAGDAAAPRLFAAVTDDPGRFAEAAVRQLREPDEALVAGARRWADEVYGVAAFEGRIRELYAEFIA